MLKFDIRFINILGRCNHHKRFRGNSHWMNIYPSPEPSFVTKMTTLLGDWVYSGLERFFEGNANNQFIEPKSVKSNQDSNSSDQIFVWELNQDILDIVISDLRAGSRYIIPPFIKDFISRIFQYFNLYIQADFIVGDEFSEDLQKGISDENFPSGDRHLRTYSYKQSLEVINAKMLLFSDWIMDRIQSVNIHLRLRRFIRPCQIQYEFSNPSSIYYNDYLISKIRGPDNFKLNSIKIFHKRI